MLALGGFARSAEGGTGEGSLDMLALLAERVWKICDTGKGEGKDLFIYEVGRQCLDKEGYKQVSRHHA